MYDQELTGFFKRHNIEYAPLDEESHKSYSSMKGFPFKGSRIAWSKIKNHRCRRLHETLEFVEEIEVILQPTDFCRFIVAGNDFEDGYLIQCSVQSVRSLLDFLVEYPGENYLIDAQGKWCICVYDYLDFGTVG